MEKKKRERRRKRLPEGWLQEFIQAYDIKSTDDLKGALADLVGDTVETMLQAELEADLGYAKNDSENKATDNSRNGSSPKTLRSEYGPIDIDVPRDRKGEFEPKIVPKYKRDIQGLDNQIISMYAKGMSTRDISTHIESLYGAEVSAETISKITDRILPEIKEWQNRPLKPLYAMMFFDAIHYPVRTEGLVKQRAVYIAIGIDLDGNRDVCGLWIGESESSKYWLSIMNELKNRGVRDILITSVDGLNGFSEAIHTVYPQTDIQRCIVHQVRNSMRYVSHKDLKAYTSEMKRIYQAPTEEAGLMELDAFEENWGKKYPAALRSWRKNWVELSTFFKYPPAIRRLIYTTNRIENFNRSLRKVTKAKAAYPSDTALLKSLYLAIQDITIKWGKISGWREIFGQLVLIFSERIFPGDYS
ncbi:MAG: IS256 family transposase [Syntrophomonadaceae bacterium]|jgi:transposase-like protein